MPAEGFADLIVAEYSSLRSEILKHLEFQAQLISLNVIALGTMLSFGIQLRNSALILIYPLLSLILGISWLNHSHAISRCAAYLSREIEPLLGPSLPGWENYVRQNPLRYCMLGYWGVRSIFLGSSVAAVIAGISLQQNTTAGIVLMSFSCAVAGATIVIFLVWREPSPRRLRTEDRTQRIMENAPAA